MDHRYDQYLTIFFCSAAIEKDVLGMSQEFLSRGLQTQVPLELTLNPSAQDGLRHQHRIERQQSSRRHNFLVSLNLHH